MSGIHRGIDFPPSIATNFLHSLTNFFTALPTPDCASNSIDMMEFPRNCIDLIILSSRCSRIDVSEHPSSSGPHGGGIKT